MLNQLLLTKSVALFYANGSSLIATNPAVVALLLLVLVALHLLPVAEVQAAVPPRAVAVAEVEGVLTKLHLFK